MVVQQASTEQTQAANIKQNRVRFLAIVATILFCPLGIPGLIFSFKSESAFREGDDICSTLLYFFYNQLTIYRIRV